MCIRDSISVETNKAFEVAEGKLFFAKSDPTEILKNELDQESTYDLKIIVPHQADFYEWKKNQLSLVSEREKEILAPILSKSINQGVKEVELDGKRILYAYDYNPATNYAYVVSLSVEKAYAVTTYLIHKSIYYGLFILGIAMLLSVLLARPL